MVAVLALSNQQHRWISGQVARELRYARFVLIIDGEGHVRKVIRNEHPQIDVLAVVGPASIGKRDIDETILLEIGMGRSYPYRQTYGITNGRPSVRITPRIKHASLDSFQLQNLFPHVRNILVTDMRAKMQNWTLKEGYKTWSLFSGDKNPERVIYPGVRYSVSFGDRAMLACVLQSELDNRQVPLEKDLKVAAQFISAVLSKYKNQYPTDGQYKLMQSRDFIRLLEFLERRGFHPHHCFLLREYLAKSKGFMLFEKVMEKECGVLLEDVFLWEELLCREEIPRFESVYTWCVKDEWQKKRIWSIRYKKYVVTKYKPQHLSFELSEIPVPF